MERLEQQRRDEQKNREYQHARAEGLENAADTGIGIEGQQPVQRLGPKVGRNDPCHCGSGKKYKHCHGRIR